METNSKNQNETNAVDDALTAVNENKHQDLSRENIGTEAEEQQFADGDSPYKLKGLEDKRPEQDTIEKGWTVDSNTSRNPGE